MSKTGAARSAMARVLLAGLLTLPACQSYQTDGPGAFGPSPENQRSIRRAREFAEATRGLTFEAGGVLVQPTGKNDPNLARAYAEHGDSLLKLNERVEAIKAYALAARTDPTFAEAFLGLGRAMISKGKLTEALASYRTAVALDPDGVEGHFALAMTLARQREFGQAIGAMQQVLELDPTRADACERLAIWSYFSGDLAGAWQYVHAAEARGHSMPPQFMAQLEAQMPDPAGG